MCEVSSATKEPLFPDNTKGYALHTHLRLWPTMADGRQNDEAAMLAAQAAEEDRVRRLHCRFYENEFPEVDECVMVNVHKIAEMGAYVNLLEYNKIEGMILLSELSRRRIRSVNKLIRVGKNEYAMVMRVDKEKGYIDLSKRRVSPEDIIKCEERYNKSKTVHSIMRHVAQTMTLVLEDLNKTIAWPLYKKYGHAYDAFRQAIIDPESVFKGELAIENETLKACLLKNIRRRLTPQPIKLRADVEVTCFSYEGIEAIKYALLKAIEKCNHKDSPIAIKLIAPPLYVITTTMLDKKLGIAKLNECIDVVREEITAKGGNIRVKMAPRATSKQEETDLALKMQELEMENREVDGDADDQ